MFSRQQKVCSLNRTAPSSHVNYRYLTTSEKDDRLERLHNLQRQTKRQVDRLSSKIAENIEHNGVIVEEGIHKDLTEIVNEHNSKVQATFPDNCFQKLFWMQQQKASALKNARSMRWHPLMIKWCLYLRHLSGRAYDMLRESGCITLPSQRTLRDYTHYVNSTTGFSTEVDKQLMEAAKVQKAEEWEKCVVLVMDEMHVKEDLVYDKHSGALIGFVNLGETNQHLLQFQQAIEGDTTDSEALAKTMFVFMVRGLFTQLEFPYAQFPCADVSGELLFDPFWEAVYHLERLGLRVLAATADGASTNRRLIKLHSNKCGEVVYKVVNPHCRDRRYLYFIADPPHLLKTLRNAWANPKRHLWVCECFYLIIYLIIYMLLFLDSAMAVTYCGGIC